MHQSCFFLAKAQLIIEEKINVIAIDSPFRAIHENICFEIF